MGTIRPIHIEGILKHEILFFADYFNKTFSPYAEVWSNGDFLFNVNSHDREKIIDAIGYYKEGFRQCRRKFRDALKKRNRELFNI